MRMILALCCVLHSTLALSADWPQFRGPSGQGLAPDAVIPLQWSETQRVRWAKDIPGKGWSSPVVQADRIWLTTAIESEPTPEQIEAQFRVSRLDRQKFTRRQVAGTVSLRVLSVHRKTGSLLSELEFASVSSPEAIHVGNSYASPTPVIEGDRLYVHFGIHGTACLNTNSGQILWQRVIPVFYSVGVGSSPVLYKNLLALVCDGIDKQFVIALDKTTGETVWRTDRPPKRAQDGQQQKAYSTPLLIRHEGRDQLIVPGAQWIVSYDPSTGAEIWRVDHGEGFSVIPRPVYARGRVYVCTGYPRPELWAIRVDGQGDVSSTHVAWKQRRQIPKNSSPLLVEDLLFVVSDNGIASCLDASTGEAHWVKRIGGNYSASPIFAAGHVFLFSHEGKSTAFKASKAAGEMLESQIEGQLMATPAVLPTSLILRTDTRLYCIE